MSRRYWRQAVEDGRGGAMIRKLLIEASVRVDRMLRDLLPPEERESGEGEER